MESANDYKSLMLANKWDLIREFLGNPRNKSLVHFLEIDNASRFNPLQYVLFCYGNVPAYRFFALPIVFTWRCCSTMGG